MAKYISFLINKTVKKLDKEISKNIVGLKEGVQYFYKGKINQDGDYDEIKIYNSNDSKRSLLYSGSFCNKSKSGSGKVYKDDALLYECEFVNSTTHRYVIEYSNDKTKRLRSFKNGNYDGFDVYYNENQVVKQIVNQDGSMYVCEMNQNRRSSVSSSSSRFPATK